MKVLFSFFVKCATVALLPVKDKAEINPVLFLEFNNRLLEVIIHVLDNSVL